MGTLVNNLAYQTQRLRTSRRPPQTTGPVLWIDRRSDCGSRFRSGKAAGAIVNVSAPELSARFQSMMNEILGAVAAVVRNTLVQIERS